MKNNGPFMVANSIAFENAHKFTSLRLVSQEPTPLS
jgi:hypothetical protein